MRSLQASERSWHAPSHPLVLRLLVPLRLKRVLLQQSLLLELLHRVPSHIWRSRMSRAYLRRSSRSLCRHQRRPVCFRRWGALERGRAVPRQQHLCAEKARHRHFRMAAHSFGAAQMVAVAGTPS
jgi:hypothetical protein